MYVLFIFRYPIEVILESGESLYVGEGVPFNYEVVLPLRVSYRATASGIVQSITVIVDAEEADLGVIPDNF